MVREVLVVIRAGGMGAAIARRLAPGRRVVLADCDAVALRTLADAMVDDGYDAIAHAVDVTDPSSVIDLANAAADRGPVVAVAHTAGVSPARASVSDILRVDLLGTGADFITGTDVLADGGVVASMLRLQLRVPT
jgi:NAD(P)-dependent dehydrogenase (short-subunit alcohol dehydrogenase family)